MYRAKKPCRFAGRDYAIGTEIPEEAVDTSRAGKLTALKIIEKVQEVSKEPEPIPEPEPVSEPIPEPEPVSEPIPEPEPVSEPIPEPAATEQAKTKAPTKKPAAKKGGK